MTGLELAAGGLFGAVAGALSGFLGIGGGAILPPLFVFALGLSQQRAQGVSLAALLPPVGLPAVLAYRRRGVHVAAALVLALVAGFVAGSWGGAHLAYRVPERALRITFSGFLLLLAARELWPARRVDDARAAPASPWVGLPIGLAAGVMSGLLGVGGGVLALPLLRRFARLGRLEAQATTLAMLLPPIALPAVSVYARSGGLPWALLAIVAVTFAAGAALGARAADRVHVRLAGAIYAGFLVVAAVLLLTR